MSAVVFEVEPREKTGTAESRRLRKQGLVPGNLYGHGVEPTAFSVSAERIRRLFSEGTRVLDVKMSGSTEKAIVREVQWDAFVTNVLHIDLLRVDASQRVNVEVTIEARGVAPGVVAGGSLDQQVRRLPVECPALEIPSSIVVSINELQIGDVVTVGDLELPDGVTAELTENTSVLQIAAPTEVSDEDLTSDAVGPLEPEVIGRSSDDDSSDD